MSIVKEFKEFILKGNILDLAFAVVIGAAFGAVINSLVKDVLLPPIGLLLGGVDFSNLYIRLNEAARALPAGTPLTAAQEAGGVVLAYGNWFMTIINFAIIAFCIFLLIKAINNIKKKPVEAPAAPTTKVCPFCKTEIPLEAIRCPHCTSQL
jgi:large conductance mechanosensitive channel